MKELEDIKIKILKLEEKIDLLIDKQSIINLVKEQKRLLHSEYGTLIYNLRKEFDKYNPKNQVNIKKVLLLSLPNKNIHIDNFLLCISEKFNEKNINYSLAEIEIFLTKIGAIKRNMVNKSFVNKKLYEALLEYL